ncbi:MULTISPECIES: hypothetical protein [unclassified Bradyrhizobium]|uniref:hypothetical protein n=1 Tax=unclassified Bradyrhizobium TaxID=2631580 RepID=UPI0028EF7D6C|nr:MULTISPECIES: hypothetical protein [unclassified Bradyrhizobium]
MSRGAWHGCDAKRAAALLRMCSMERRDMLLLAGLLLWVGTEYVLNHVVIPLIDD